MLLVILEILRLKFPCCSTEQHKFCCVFSLSRFEIPACRCLVLQLETNILKLRDFSPRLSQIPGFSGKAPPPPPPHSRSCRFAGVEEWPPFPDSVLSSPVSTISCRSLSCFLHCPPAWPPILLSLHSLFPR